MQESVIFYFSGSGNSYYVAKKIAEGTGASLIPMTQLEKQNTLDFDQIGFVFPSYDFKPPEYVSKLFENIESINANYVYAVCTYGISLSKALYKFNKTLSELNSKLDAGFGVKMPHNAVGSYNFSDAIVQSRIQNASEYIDSIIDKVSQKCLGPLEKTSILEDGTLIKNFPMLMHFLFILVTKGTKGLSYKVWDDCISCNQCANICPVNNIEMVDGKPVFGNHCTGCFACIQWCPKHAIHIGNYEFDRIYIKHYHHPDVTPSELIQAKSKALH